jgi:hypothetical protein
MVSSEDYTPAGKPDLLRRRAAFALLACLLALVTPAAAAFDRSAESPDGVPQRLVLAIDGIPYDVFVELQGRGHFSAFRPAARMVSTFPSLSDVAFAAIEGGDPPDGYQTTHYDPVRNKVVGHSIGALSERAHPKIASDATSHSVPHRVMGYVTPQRIALGELREIGRDLLRSRKQTFVAYLGTSDAVLHLKGRAGAETFLLQVDAYLQDLQARVRERTGRELMIDIVSDHGSTMVGSKVVPVEKLLGQCGFRRNRGMTEAIDTAYSLPGIVGSLAITASPEGAEAAARCLAVAEGMDLVAINRGDAVGVLTADGEAEVRLLATFPERYGYRALRGDPLGLLDGAATEQVFEQATVFRQTRDAPRPDPLRRLWRAFHGDVKKPSALLLSLDDGYEVGNPALRLMTRLRGGHAGTHGSMTRLASLGVITSNWRDVDDVNVASANHALFGAGAITAMKLALAKRADDARHDGSSASRR